MKGKFISMLALVFISLQIPTYAQDWDEGQSEIEDKEFVVEKDRKLTLPAAVRNFEKVPPFPLSSFKSNLSYSFKEIPYLVTDFQPKIRILTVKEDLLQKLYGNYIKAGVGNYLTPMVDAYFHNKRAKNASFGLNVGHISSQNGPVDKQNSGNSLTKLGLSGKVISPMVSLGTQLNYRRKGFHYYGYLPNAVIEKEDIKQVINSYDATVDLSSSKTTPFDFTAAGNLKFLNNQSDDKESILSLKLDVKYDIANHLGIGVKSLARISKLTFPNEVSRNLYQVKPFARFFIEDFEINAGLNFVYENDSIYGDGKLHSYPFATASLNVSEQLSVFAGFGGDISQNYLHDYLEENPFLASGSDVYHTNKTFEIYGGVNGNAMKNLAVGAGFSFGRYKNLPFFVNNNVDVSKFDVIYDDGDSEKLNLYGEMSYQKSKDFKASVRFDYFGYNLDSIAEAWHKPQYQATIVTSNKIMQKFVLETSLEAMGGVKALDPTTQTSVDLDAIFDLGFEVNYLYSKRVTAFISVDNLLNQKRQLYLNYPTRGALAMIGITYSF